jgi:hypothetical protein
MEQAVRHANHFCILRRAHQEHRSKVRRGHACEMLSSIGQKNTEYWAVDGCFGDQNTSVNTIGGTGTMKKNKWVCIAVTVLVPWVSVNRVACLNCTWSLYVAVMCTTMFNTYVIKNGNICRYHLSVRHLLVLIACTNQVPVLSVLYQPGIPWSSKQEQPGVRTARPWRRGRWCVWQWRWAQTAWRSPPCATRPWTRPAPRQ